MRYAWLVLVALGCAPPPPAVQEPDVQPRVQRLPAPALANPDAPGAAYLTAVALSLQPTWHQFLEDCRLRLPARHALNDVSLVALAEIEVDERGHVENIQLATSGNKDFDRAARQVILDASPLPPPPRELWSDDDHVHLAWTFARDRRQAGPATAHVVHVELPLRGVVDRLIGQRDLTRAARRILRAGPSTDRDVATKKLMVAALREGLASSDGAVRRAAVDAVARAGLVELAQQVRELLAGTSDADMLLAAMRAAAALGDTASAETLVEQLRAALVDDSRLAMHAAAALVTLGRQRDADQVLVREASRTPPNPRALQVLAVIPVPELAPRLPDWMRARSARTRAGACSAMPGYRGDNTWSLVERALRDRDATVRAACILAARMIREPAPPKSTIARLRKLARDRDNTVRAGAIRTVAALDPDRMVRAVADKSSEVRAAYAMAIARTHVREREPDLLELIDDRDPDVRAAAWAALGQPDGPLDRAARAARAATDSAAQVRRVVVDLIDDDALLERIANNDESADVRSAALVRLAARRGRGASTELLVQRLAGTTPGSAERVRTASAWLFAR